MEHGDLRLTVLEANSTVRIGDPYDITCRLTNSSERSMDLQLNLNTTAKLGCGYTGASEFMVSNLNLLSFSQFRNCIENIWNEY